MIDVETLPASAHGEWPGGWGATEADPSSRDWREGWDRRDHCPPDVKDRANPCAPRGEPGTWREAGLAGGDTWRELHNDRRGLYRLLRKAGYVSRHRWGRHLAGYRQVGRHTVEDWRVIDGPAGGCQAVDPWKVARALRRCAFGWYIQARITGAGNLTALAVPRLCNRKHECPVCAHTRSGYLAGALKAVVAHLDSIEAAPLILATFTHRDHVDETLQDALGRLDQAWQALTALPWWRDAVDGWYYGIEVTRGQAAEGGASAGRWWHAHRHVVLRLRPGVNPDRLRDLIAARWEELTDTIARARGVPGYGWQPAAGGCVRGTYAGPWWKPIDASDPAEVYQACKYPTPLAELHPVPLAEWLCVAHGRRWHDGGGSLRGVIRQADELEAAGGGWTIEAERAEVPDVDLGVIVHACGPKEAPVLDDVAPDHGWPGRPVEAPRVAVVRWTLSAGADLEAVRQAAAKVDGWIDLPEACERRPPVLVLPAEWVAAELRRVSLAIAEARSRARPPPEA